MSANASPLKLRQFHPSSPARAFLPLLWIWCKPFHVRPLASKAGKLQYFSRIQRPLGLSLPDWVHRLWSLPAYQALFALNGSPEVITGTSLIFFDRITTLHHLLFLLFAIHFSADTLAVVSLFLFTKLLFCKYFANGTHAASTGRLKSFHLVATEFPAYLLLEF